MARKTWPHVCSHPLSKVGGFFFRHESQVTFMKYVVPVDGPLSLAQRGEVLSKKRLV